MLINIVFCKALVSHVFVRDSCNIYGGLSGTRRQCLHLFVTQDPLAGQESIPLGAHRPVDSMEGLASPGTLESKSRLHKGTQKRLGNQLGVLPVSLIRTQVQIIDLPVGGRRGD
jgi:hypothetical protein